MMKRILWFSTLIIIVILLLFNTGCKKDKIENPNNAEDVTVPVLTTTAVSNIEGTTATSGGNITSDGGLTVTARGVCWSTGITPTITDNKTTDGAGVGSFSSNITGLNGSTTYFVRAYATNSSGTGYGMAISFSTLGQAPIVTTQSANVQVNTATLNGIVNANYFTTTVTFEYGTTTNYGSTSVATQSPVTGYENTNVSVNLTGLSTNTTYHFRVKAINELGTAYGSDISFTTLGQAPTAITQEATNVQVNTATLNGIVNANYLSTIVTFEYGTTTSYGNSTTASQSPVSGSTDTDVGIDIIGLTPGSTYHFRVKAINELGTTYGNDMTFTPNYEIGKTYAGGIIFYIDNTGQHGLIAATSDIGGVGIQWDNGDFVVTNATGTAVGTGQANTTTIVSVQGAGSYAASICDQLVLNGYSDWFLPSKDEIKLLYLQKTVVGGFNAIFYWSSTEFDYYQAWIQRFDNGNQGLHIKGNNEHVRPVRVF